MSGNARRFLLLLAVCGAMGAGMTFLISLIGCVQPHAVVGVERGGVVVTPDVRVPIASPDSHQATSQPVTAHVAPTAGGDARTVTIQIPITASGSGWPLAVVAGLVGVAVFMWWRAARQRNTRTRQVLTVADAVHGASPEARQEIVSSLDGQMPDEEGFKRLLDKNGKRVHRAARREL